MKFSPQYGTFYPDDLRPDALPDDVINVSDEDFHLATNRQPGDSLVFTDGKLYVVPRANRSTVPMVVTMRQARLALLQAGMLSQVNTAVATADEATKITWEFSSEVQRNNPLVSTLAAALSLTDAQLDDLFTLAATL